MNSFSKGLVLGAANVITVAVAIALVVGRGRHEYMEVFAFVLAMGIIPGIVIGGAIGLLAGRLPTLRRFTLCALSALGVVVLGNVIEPSMIGPAMPTTIAFTLILEKWTRTVVVPCQISGTWRGLLLGIVNVFAVATLAGLTAWLEAPAPDDYFHARHVALDVGAFIAFAGLMPGIATGALLGWLAGDTSCASMRPLARLAVIAIPAVIVVVALGLIGNGASMIASACIPTVAVAAILERWTRQVTLPIALARA